MSVEEMLAKRPADRAALEAHKKSLLAKIREREAREAAPDARAEAAASEFELGAR